MSAVVWQHYSRTGASKYAPVRHHFGEVSSPFKRGFSAQGIRVLFAPDGSLCAVTVRNPGRSGRLKTLFGPRLCMGGQGRGRTVDLPIFRGRARRPVGRSDGGLISDGAGQGRPGHHWWRRLSPWVTGVCGQTVSNSARPVAVLARGLTPVGARRIFARLEPEMVHAVVGRGCGPPPCSSRAGE